MNDTSLRSQILQKIAELAGTDPTAIDDRATLDSLGLDSSDAVILALEVEQATSREIDAGIFLRNATIAEAAAEIERICAQ